MTASDPAPADSSATDPTSAAPTPEVIFLGTGTSVGVPAIGCECDVCQSTDRHNNRTRCSILIRLPEGNLLIDTPPDLRTQLLREKVKLVHAVLFTHEHADHIYGLDDLRLFPFRLGRPVPLHCRADVEARIRTSYDYAFSKREQTHAGSRPQLEILSINNDDPFEVLGVRVMPVPLKHGPHFEVLGFRMGDFAYCTDTNHISETSMNRLRGLDTLVLDALRFTPHPTHFNIDEALEVIEELKPRQAFLTHLGHDIDHGPVEASLPDHVHLAYDGLRLPMPSIA